MMTGVPTLRALGGVWKRELNYDPRDVLDDNAQLHGSTVFWIQHPTNGSYVDVRHVRSEGFKVRGFGGVASVEADPNGDTTAWKTTWNRIVDTKPESCPTGIDSATCRVVGPLTTNAPTTDQPVLNSVLMEEGDGYLEVWRRIAIPTTEDYALLAGTEEEKKEGTAQEAATNRVIEVTVGSFKGVASTVLDTRPRVNESKDDSQKKTPEFIPRVQLFTEGQFEEAKFDSHSNREEQA